MKQSVIPGLETLRRERGIRRSEMAELLGVHYSSIYFWEMGLCAPRLESLLKIARAFGVTPNDLLEFDIDARDTRAMHYHEGVRRYLS
jgi:DNA-binding XRE family transcriptional regulator